ncbi:MAG: Phage tail collar domain protein [Verrucomicrobiaceae bacterium]|nr:Phage tail collar domain protein [Verrucomicrobiaceae bacterium]
MSDSYIGEIRMFAGNFAPRGWALCNGQILPILDNEALFSLLAFTYGGDGQTTFGLPNMQGRIPIHFGQGAGFSNNTLGQVGGTELVTLTQATTPPHSHLAVGASASSGAVPSPAGNVWSANANSASPQFAAASTTPVVNMAAASVSNLGSSVPHDNMAPTLAVNFIILVEGIYPAQT